ncbi:hypothetical protein [Ruegeria lacuscaerulensis]|uniref:hypothetical protein n=1 Tax=Ruegeria lacuscaerulensis TaxID=55218 RepID=UPI00147B5FBC|nr:hypothetical protein [Ruegeria lacuscaerulensis]
MAVRSKITLFNAALLRTGNDPAVEGDGSFIWQALEANYDEIVRAAFEEQEFTFGKARVELKSRAEGDFGYDDAFTLPHDVIHVQEVYLNEISAARLGESWELDTSKGTLLIDADKRTVEIEYIKVGLEHTWSGKFARAIQRSLEAVIKDVLEEMEESQALENEASYQLMKAGVKSSKNRSGEKFRRGGRLVRAHHGYPRR